MPQLALWLLYIYMEHCEEQAWMSSLYRELVSMLQAAGFAVVYDQPIMLHVHKLLEELLGSY